MIADQGRETRAIPSSAPRVGRMMRRSKESATGFGRQTVQQGWRAPAKPCPQPQRFSALAACSVSDGFPPPHAPAAVPDRPPLRSRSRIRASPIPIHTNGTAAHPGPTLSTASTSRNTRARSTGQRPRHRRLLRLHQGDRGRRPRRRPFRRELARRPRRRHPARRLSFLSISAAPAPSRRAGSSRTCRTIAGACRRCSTWSGTTYRRAASCGPPRRRSIARCDLPDIVESTTASGRSSTPRSTSSTTTCCHGFRGYPFWLRSVAGHPTQTMRSPLDLLAIHRNRRHPWRSRQCRHQRLQRQHVCVEEMVEDECDLREPAAGHPGFAAQADSLSNEPRAAPVKILILGGYGVFGGRLAELLADLPAIELLICGRDLARAEAFCRRYQGQARVRPLALDRADIAAPLRMHRPDLVVDASGPFQDYGADRYRVIDGLHRGRRRLSRFRRRRRFRVRRAAASMRRRRRRGCSCCRASAAFPR